MRKREMVLILISFFAFALRVGTEVYHWSFDNPANYSYDSNKIEITGGYAQLKSITEPPWWNEDWQYRRRVTITHTKNTPTTLVFYPVADTWTNGGWAEDTNYGADKGLALHLEGGWDRHIYVKFSLTSLSDLTIISATLKLYYFKNYDSKRHPTGERSGGCSRSSTIGVFRMENLWEENTLTYANSQSLSYANETARAECEGNSPHWLSWDVTPDVQGFADGRYFNHGWTIRIVSGGYAHYPCFYSRESTFGYYQPRLEVKTIPKLPIGYSVKVTLDTQGDKFMETGDDLRIIYFDGRNNIELSRVNETPFNSSHTEIWFSLQKEILPNKSDNNYWIYYGNPAAGKPRVNKNEVYLFWDDFEAYSINADAQPTWSAGSTNVRCRVVEDNGNKVYRLTHNGRANTEGAQVVDISLSSGVYEGKMKIINADQNHNGLAFRAVNLDNEANIHTYIVQLRRNEGESSIVEFNAGNWVGKVNTASYPISLNQWYTLKVVYTENTFNFYVDGNLILSGQDSTINSGGIGVAAYGGDVYFDEIKARYYFSPEPNLTVGVEQKQEEIIYSTDNPNIFPVSSLSFSRVEGFIETAVKNGGEIKYTLSNDNGITWLYYTPSGWVTSNNTYNQANTAGEINANISLFPVGGGKFLFNAFLHSEGKQLVKLDNIQVTYLPPTKVDLTLFEVSSHPIGVIRKYNVLGQMVKKIMLDKYFINFVDNNPSNWNSKNISSGVYFYQLVINNEVVGIKKALLLK
jgi:hypothetical protein